MVEYLFCGSIYEYYIIIPDRDAFYAIFLLYSLKKNTHTKKTKLGSFLMFFSSILLMSKTKLKTKIPKWPFYVPCNYSFSSNKSNDTDDKDTTDYQNHNPYQKRSYWLILVCLMPHGAEVLGA